MVVNGTNSGTATGPYRQTYQHDAFGNMTNRTNRFWSQTDIFTASYANNRRQNQAFQYDAVGNLTQDTDLQYAYDAAGLNTSVVSAAANKTIAPVYDGDGQVVRRVETESGVTSSTYYVRSSVLGNVITELNAQGVKLKSYVYLGGQGRLDDLAFQLINDPRMKGYIITYAGKVSKKLEARTMAEKAMRHFTDLRKIPTGRITAIDGGFRETAEYELFLVPSEMPPPTPTPTVPSNQVTIIGKQRKSFRKARSKLARRGIADSRSITEHISLKNTASQGDWERPVP